MYILCSKPYQTAVNSLDKGNRIKSGQMIDSSGRDIGEDRNRGLEDWILVWSCIRIWGEERVSFVEKIKVEELRQNWTLVNKFVLLTNLDLILRTIVIMDSKLDNLMCLDIL